MPAPPIADSSYGIEYTQGPFLGSNRAVGLGGAGTAISEGAEGIASNPAATAVRSFTSTSWFDWSVTAGLSFPGAYGKTDFENRGALGRTDGSQTYSDFLHVGLGFSLTFGDFGIGATYDVNSTEVFPPTASERGLDLDLTTVRIPISYAIHDGQIVFGAGLRLVDFALAETTETDITGDVLYATATGFEGGVVVKPNESRWRTSFTFRSAASASMKGPGVPDFVPPSRFVAPVELEAGIAYQLGARPLNPRFIDARAAKQPSLAEERRLERRAKVLLVASLIAFGPTSNNVAISGFLDQTKQVVGESMTFSPRAGVEIEPVPRRLMVQLGSYAEPSRYADVGARYHATLGGRLRLFEWSIFGLRPHTSFTLTSSADISTRDYFDWGLSFGFWE